MRGWGQAMDLGLDGWGTSIKTRCPEYLNRILLWGGGPSVVSRAAS